MNTILLSGDEDDKLLPRGDSTIGFLMTLLGRYRELEIILDFCSSFHTNFDFNMFIVTWLYYILCSDVTRGVI